MSYTEMLQVILEKLEKVSVSKLELIYRFVIGI